EARECWQLAIESAHGPSVLARTRQNLPQLRKELAAANLCATGAYEIAPAEGKVAVSLFASGSEVAIAMAARRILAERGVATRVVSVPCLDLFLAQAAELRRSIIGDAPVKVAVEAGVRQGWDAIIGAGGAFVGMSTFGASAPYQELFRHFGITAEKVAEAALAKMGKS